MDTISAVIRFLVDKGILSWDEIDKEIELMKEEQFYNELNSMFNNTIE